MTRASRFRRSSLLLLAAAMAALAVLFAFGGAAHAQPSTTDYDSDDDGLIEVSSLAQLDAIRWDLDGDGAASDAGYATAFPNPATGMGCPTSGCVGYELAASLDFDTNGSGGADAGDDYWNGGHGWLPIGIDGDPFTAIFEGNGNVISNLYIDTGPKQQSDATGVPVAEIQLAHFGLFEEVGATGVIRNVGLEDVDVSREHYCHSRPQIICNRGRVGGLAGVNHGKISGSWVTGAVSNTANGGDHIEYRYIRDHYRTNVSLAAGGLVGFAGSSSVISNSYSAVAVYLHADWERVRIKGGGVAGHNAGSIIASYAIGEVYSDRISTSWHGGGRFTGNFGGLVGYNSGPITASYARGAVSGPPQFRARSGLVGYKNGSPAITASYWDTVASGQSGSHAGVGRTTAELQSPTGYSGIYANWNVDLDGDGNGDDPWAFGTASQYPVLKSLGVTKQRGLTPGRIPRIDYDSDDDGLIDISRSFHLMVARADPNGDGSPREARYDYQRRDYYAAILRAADGMGCPPTGCVGYELVSDLNMSGASWTWDFGSYSAIFEGNGHTIVNHRGGSMFHQIQASGVVRNLTLRSSSAASYWPNVGGLAGVNHGAISNVHVAGYVDAIKGVGGGLVGLNGPTGTISDSSSAGRVVYGGTRPGTDIGGLVGRNAGSIRSSYSTARAGGQSTSNVGGLVGYNTSTGSIRGSYARGEAESKVNIYDWGHPRGRNIGGLVGNNEGEITASYSTGHVSNCGAYSGRCGDEPMGGLVGRNNGGTVTNSYWDTRTSRWTTSAGGVGRTTEQLQQPWAYQGIYAGWNLDLDGDGSPDDPWDFGAPDRYPKLKSPEQREQGVNTFILTPEVRFLEGRSAKLTITLNRPAPAGGVEFTVTPSFNDATLRDEVASIASPVTVAAGETTAAIAVAHSPDDRLDEPDKTFTVTVAATTAGWRKAGDGWDTATVTVGDDDPPGLRYERTGGRLGEPSLRVAEGGTGTYSLAMASRLLANVTVTATSGDPGALTVSPASHTFTPSDWETPKTFTVTGVADADANDEIVGIAHRITKQGATDSRYSGHVVVAVSDTTSSGQRQQSPQRQAPADYADLIAQMYQWREDPQWRHQKSHTDRWDRALLAFGETVSDASLTAMTAAEAQALADQDWGERWVPVAAALRELENQAPSVSAALADVSGLEAGDTLDISLSGVFDDADGDALTITAASSDETIATVSVADPSARAIIEAPEGAATMSVSPDHSSLTLTGQVPGAATVTVTANDGKGGAASADFVATVEAGESETEETQETETTEPYAALIAQMKEWREDPQWRHQKAHTDRWDRALLAFGETVADTSLTPMTAAEAQAFADRGSAWSRWVEVAAALRELEAAGQQDQQQQTPNRAPTVSAAIADATIVNQSGTRTVSLTGVFSDADNDALTVTAASSDEAVAAVSVASDYSSLTVSAQGRGTASITVTADDGNGGTVDDAFTVTVKAAPVVASALADVSGLEVGATQDVSLSGVFSDADGDTLTVTSASSDEAIANVTVSADQSTLTLAGVAEGTATITVTAQDSDGNRVSDAFETPVARKYAALIAQMYQWREDPQWRHQKSHTDRWDRALLAFGETVADTTLTAMTADQAQALADSGLTRWVEVAQALREIEGGSQQEQPNRAPTVSAAIADATIVNQSGTRQVSLSGVFNDADGDALTITAASSDEAKATVSVASDGSSLTVSAQARGTAVITVTANDGNGGTASDSFTVTVKAAPVVASAIADVSGLEVGATQEVSLSGVFSDADGDALTITAASSDETKVTVSVSADYSTLTLTGVAEGTTTVTVTAQDSDGNRVSDAFQVEVVAAEAQDEGAPTPVSNLSCDARTDRVTFRWDAPQWSGAEVYAYDYVVGRPDGQWKLVRLQGYPVVNEPGEYQAGTKASISIKAVYENPDGSEVSSAAVSLTCTVGE